MLCQLSYCPTAPTARRDASVSGRTETLAFGTKGLSLVVIP